MKRKLRMALNEASKEAFGKRSIWSKSLDRGYTVPDEDGKNEKLSLGLNEIILLMFFNLSQMKRKNGDELIANIYNELDKEQQDTFDSYILNSDQEKLKKMKEDEAKKQEEAEIEWDLTLSKAIELDNKQ